MELNETLNFENAEGTMGEDTMDCVRGAQSSQSQAAPVDLDSMPDNANTMRGDIDVLAIEHIPMSVDTHPVSESFLQDETCILDESDAATVGRTVAIQELKGSSLPPTSERHVGEAGATPEFEIREGSDTGALIEDGHPNLETCAQESVGVAQESELERETELYEATEREEVLVSYTVKRSALDARNESHNTVEQDDEKHTPEVDMSESRRKRGRPPGKTRKKEVKKEERKGEKKEEDVCFVCFDGGNLILCDKRSCPKAYHIECTGRESEFFEKKGQWFCGWHVCAHCSKSATIHCYTCPSAFCSTCLREADFLCIRKGQGLCEVCYRLVRMIEQNETINADGVQVDFNDQETYEGLFKEYWENLKLKLSLTREELDKASKAKEAGELFQNDDVDEQQEDQASTDSEGKPTPRRSLRLLKIKRVTRSMAATDASGSEYEEEEEEEGEDDDEENENNLLNTREFVGWASKDLMDFMKSIKEDTRKPLSLLAVKKMLLAYVDENNLINPRRKGQIACDEKLHKVFGKKHVGKLEMRRLLRLHIAPKRSIPYRDGGDDVLEIETSEDDRLLSKNTSVDKQHKFKRKSDSSAKNSRPDPSDFVAIDVNNINLIYLKRSLLEDLHGDPEFVSKVVGAFVRIRVPGSVNKNETCYRLVPIVGVKQVPDTPNPGKEILEILNLQKHEEVTIDQVSSQDFTEEECYRLRQSFKYGFLKAMTVGDLEEKARDLRAAKLKDWFELELLRLSHLRDRASEIGHRKELRECVEKLQLLSSPAERERQLIAPLQINVDPLMDPESKPQNEEIPVNFSQGISVEAKKSQLPSGKCWETGSNVGFIREPDKLKTPSSAICGWDPKGLGKDNVWENTASRNFKGGWGEDLGLLTGQHKESSGKRDGGWEVFPDNVEKSPGWANQTTFNNRLEGALPKESENFRKQPYSQAGPATEWRGKRDHNHTGTYSLPAPPVGAAVPVAPVVVAEKSGTDVVIEKEKEKVWHYQDPSKTIQGPFSMEQLRKWEKTKLFPLDLRIWKTTQSEDESILLTDALLGKFPKKWAGYMHTEPPSANSAQLGWGAMANHPSNDWQVQGRNMDLIQRIPLKMNGGSAWGSGWAMEKPAIGNNGWGTKVFNEPSEFPQGIRAWEPNHRVPLYNDRPGFDGRHTKKKDVPCRYFSKGMCKKGQACEFKHE